GSAQASLRTGQRADCREASPARQADHVQQHGGADPALRADHAQPWVRDPARRSVRLDRELQRRARLLPGGRRRRVRLAGAHAPTVVHPLCDFPAHHQGPLARRRGGRAGKPEHHRGGARPLSRDQRDRTGDDCRYSELAATARDETRTKDHRSMPADVTTTPSMRIPILSEPLRQKITALFPRYPSKRAVTLPALHMVQEHLRCVPYQAMAEIAELLERACKRLGIEPGETTADGKLTVEYAECLGICDFAPAALADDGRVFGPLDEAAVDSMLDELRGTSPRQE